MFHRRFELRDESESVNVQRMFFKINQALNNYEKLWKLYLLRVKQIHPFIRYSGRAVASNSGLYFNQM